LLIIAKITFVSFIPWTVPIIYAVLVFVGINGIRFIFRSAFRQRSNQNKKQIAIYGAGAAGAQTIQSLKSNQNYQVRMIIDDADNLQGKRVFGLKVMSFSEASNKFNQYGINIVLLAIPSAGFSARKEIISRLSNFSVEVKTVPGISSLIDGSVSINELKDVNVEDLLGRETVKPDSNLLEKILMGKLFLSRVLAAQLEVN
jgi:FlaA1/EpsC-like NDP-sugar epimerase